MQAVETNSRESGVGIRESLIGTRQSQSEIGIRKSAIGRETARILMVAGGTGGHIYPALAVAEELRQRSEAGRGAEFKIEFLGTTRSLETRLIPSAGYVLHAVHAEGLKGIGGWRRIQNFLVLPRSSIEAAMVLRKFQPQAVVGAGGYISGPAMLEAALQGIPTLIIEPNALAGFTSRALAPLGRTHTPGGPSLLFGFLPLAFRSWLEASSIPGSSQPRLLRPSAQVSSPGRYSITASAGARFISLTPSRR